MLNLMMKELTKSEEQIMQILWTLDRGFVKDIVECFDPPRPAYTTVSTMIRILEKKGFVAHQAYGNSHEYYPLVARKSYTRWLVKGLMARYFDNSFRQMVSYFAGEEELNMKGLEELKRLLEEEKQIKA